MLMSLKVTFVKGKWNTCVQRQSCRCLSVEVLEFCYICDTIGARGDVIDTILATVKSG